MNADELQQVCSARFRAGRGTSYGSVIDDAIPLDELEVIARARVSDRLARWRELDDERATTAGSFVDRPEPEANEWRSAEDMALWIDGVIAGLAIAERLRL